MAKPRPSRLASIKVCRFLYPFEPINATRAGLLGSPPQDI